MSEPTARRWRSPIDSERFGFPVDRLEVAPDGGRQAVRDALVDDSGWRLLISRCESDDLAAASELERTGGRLMDVHVTFERDLRGPDGFGAVPADEEPAGVEPGPDVRSLTPADAEAVGRLFALSFATYAGHYHADPRLDDQRCSAIYADWAGRLVGGGGDETVALAARDHDGTILAATLLTHEPGTEVAHGVLDAVHPTARGRGLYRILGRERARRAASRGASRLQVSTHLQNLVTCRNLSRLGFLPHRAQLTFHSWND